VTGAGIIRLSYFTYIKGTNTGPMHYLNALVQSFGRHLLIGVKAEVAFHIHDLLLSQIYSRSGDNAKTISAQQHHYTFLADKHFGI